MLRLGSGLLCWGGGVAGNPFPVNGIAGGLVFRGVEEECTHNPNKISAFAAELVFREIPGESAQGCGDAERFGRRGRVRGIALVNSAGGRVAGVALAPTGLRFLPARGLAFRLTASSLALADSGVQIEPPPADPAGFLPGFGHEPSSATLAWFTSYEHGWVSLA
jgi:hypothetical protein